MLKKLAKHLALLLGILLGATLLVFLSRTHFWINFNIYRGIPGLSPIEFTIDTSGNVGVGTTGPLRKLDVIGQISARNSVANDIEITLGADANSTNIYSSYGTTGSFKPMYFWVNNGIKMVLDTSGNVGIGTTSPSQKLEVNGRIRMDIWTADGDVVVYKNPSGDIGLNSSDLRLKKNLEPISSALDKVLGLTGYLYNPVGEPDGAKKRLGVVAQDLIAVGLSEVTYTFTNEAGQEYFGVHYEKLTALLVEAVKE